jgi:hypothetical protein
MPPSYLGSRAKSSRFRTKTANIGGASFAPRDHPFEVRFFGVILDGVSSPSIRSITERIEALQNGIRTVEIHPSNALNGHWIDGGR